MVNRYAGYCVVCKGRVLPKAGILKRSQAGKYYVLHLICNDDKRATTQVVNTYTFSSGESVTQNANGRCIDAPCCGCCTS